VDGGTVVDTEHGIFVPVHKRRVGYVFQDGRLFPHLTVRQNLLYGRWFAPKTEPHVGLDAIADLLGIAALLDRRPAKLSGGEKQRVAIGRALLASPRLLLMDEPLAALDEARKAEILPYIERLRDESGVPIVYVSHSVPEVARLADTVVLMSEGSVAAVGPTSEILQRLDLVPLTGRAEPGAIIEAIVEAHDDAFGLTMLRSPAGLWRLPRARGDAGDQGTREHQRSQCHGRRGGRYRHRRRRGDRRAHRLQRRGAAGQADALFRRPSGPAARNTRIRPGQERRLRPPPTARWRPERRCD
jgi:molybdate transport system ATP-binding protein